MKYFEGKRQRAAETLQILRDFHSEKNTVYGYSNKLKNLVYFSVLNRHGEEDPIKTLKRIQGKVERRSRYSTSYGDLLYKAKEFVSLSNGDKEAITTTRVKKGREHEMMHALKQWVQYSQPLLLEIINNHLPEMDGFEYFLYWAEGGIPFHARIKNIEGKLYSEDFSYYGTYTPKLSISRDVAGYILDNLMPKKAPVIKSFSNPDGTYNYRDLSILEKFIIQNHKRNKLVREIESRTGINLKKEVYKRRYGSG